MRQSSVILYDKDECPFCWKVRLALTTKSLQVEHITIDTENKPADFLALSPTGKVPLLISNGELISESSVIIETLELWQPNPSLLGKHPQERERIATLNHYSDTVVGPAIRDAIFTQRGHPSSQWDMDAIEQSKRNWSDCLAWLNNQFEPSDPSRPAFLSCFSLAECALLPRFALASAYGLHQVQEFPELQRWFDYHRQQPYFVTTAPAVFLRLKKPIHLKI